MSGSSEGSGFPGAPLTLKFCIRADNIRNIVWRANVSPAHRRLPGNMRAKQIFQEIKFHILWYTGTWIPNFMGHGP
jgi:hypothetical protein